MINYIKKDFRRCREALNYSLGWKVPLGLFTLYYIVVGIIVLPLAPFAWLYCKIQMRRLMKDLEKGI